MEWVIFFAAIVGIVLVVVLIDFNMRLSEVQEEIGRIGHWQQVTYQIADRLEDKADVLDVQLECARDDLRQLAGSVHHVLDTELVDLAGRIMDAHTKIEQVHNEFQNADVPATADEFSFDADELSQNELARLARKREFDKRIAEMREELGFETYGTHADETHPDVKNLPHNIIPTSLYDLPSVEIAD